MSLETQLLLEKVLGFFLVSWVLMATYVSVILHRSIAHRAVLLPQWFCDGITAIAATLVIYVNPRVWVAEHRLHHAHSDTDDDPDKKPGWNLWRFIWWSLSNPAGPHDEHVARISQDRTLRTPVMRFYSDPRVGVVCQLGTGQVVPYLLMGTLWGTLSVWLGIRLGGIVVKAIQGYFSHSKSYGYRNFETDDNSSNLNGWFSTFMSAGESLQNNHHARPTSPIHAFKPGERDFGYALVWLYAKVGLATFPAKSTLTPIPEVVPA